MNIFVCIKQVPDTTTRIKLRGDGNGIDEADIQWIISPHDELAIEEALRLREQEPESIITVLSAGPERVTDSLRMALAMGVDSAVQVDLPGDADSAMNARALAAVIGRLGQTDIILTGKEAVDDGAAAVGPMLAVFLGLPCVTVVNGIDYGDGAITCRRDVGGGNIEVIETPLPAVVAAQVGLNEPRYATALNIIKAKKKPIDTLSADELGITEADRKMRLKNFELPPPKQPCRLIEGATAEQANELIRVLAEEIQAI
ncbi:MAG: electron transfer flavoprotein subunit beta/FixA family protein [Verrucomicrobiota bacterium]|jgi:electron transfer flavoprotein beta subunit|nr:electron transfer flavoprotein subunit beta/FixA family protein [Verrucomicrobiota bacterium]